MLYRKSQLVLLALILVFGIYIFPTEWARIHEETGHNINPLDTRLHYSLSDVKDEFEGLKPQGRLMYKSVLIRVDFIFPVIYCGFLSLLIYSLLKQLSYTGWKMICFTCISWLACGCDVLENFNTITMIDQSNPHLQLTSEQVAWGERMTQCKWAFLFVSVVTAIVLSIQNFIFKKELKPQASTVNQKQT